MAVQRATVFVSVAGSAPSAEAFAAPASHFQRLHVARSDGGRLTHNVQLQWRLRGRIDVDVVQAALDVLAARHEALRTSLRATPLGTVQVIVPRVDVPLAPLDPSGFGHRSRWRQLRMAARREARRPFELAVAPLLRPALIRLAAQEHHLLLTASHAVWDGWSSGLALRDFAVAYDALCEGEQPRLPALSLQFADHVGAWRNWSLPLADYWRRQLRDYQPLISVTSDAVPRAPVRYVPGALQFRAAAPAVLARLRAVASRAGATVGIALIAALFVVLWIASGRERLFVAFNDANRDEPGCRDVIGPFLSFLILAARLHRESTLEGVLHETRDGVLGAYAHRTDVDQQVPSGEPRWSDPQWPVIHDAWINFFPWTTGFAVATRPIRAGRLEIQPLGVTGASETRWNDGALGLTLVESASGSLDGTVVYNAAVLDPARAHSLGCAYSRILLAMVGHVNESLAALRTQAYFSHINPQLV